MQGKRNPERTEPAHAEETDFSLAIGGPLYRMWLRTGLVRPPLGLLHRRLVVLVAITWVPLLVLTLLEGHALGGVRVPFLHDIESFARFLVAVPLLVFAEPVAHRRLHGVVNEFVENRIVPDAAMPRFNAAIARTMRLRNSVLVEIGILVIVYAIGPWTWEHGLALNVDSWSMIDGRTTGAGLWYLYVSAPIFQFLLLRWLFRIALWWVFLWRVSRLPLALTPLHPDRAGGIGFLGRDLPALLPIMIAQGAVVSGLIFSRVTFGTDALAQYQALIVAMIVYLVLLAIGPLLFFSVRLVDARRDALVRFGVIATRYARDFDHKWMTGSPPTDEALLGSADIQSMADLAGTHEIVHGMRAVPFDLRTLAVFVLATASPFLPLVLTVVPLDELVKALALMVL